MNELIAIQSKLKAPKSQYNDFGKYHYRNCEDILEAVKPLLKEQDCFLTLCDDIVSIANRVYVKAVATITNKDGKTITVPAFARESEDKKGMDSAQITGAASSYARKYALNGLFLIDDTKDSDATNDHGKATEADLKAAQERARVALKGKDTPHTPETPPAQHQTTPAAPKPPVDGPNIANGFIFAIHPENAGGYKTYELDNEKGPEGYNKRFATKDPDIIQTIEKHHENGERVSWIYTVVPWKKGAKSGLNYAIQEMIQAEEPATAQPGD